MGKPAISGAPSRRVILAGAIAAPAIAIPAAIGAGIQDTRWTEALARCRAIDAEFVALCEAQENAQDAFFAARHRIAPPSLPYDRPDGEWWTDRSYELAHHRPIEVVVNLKGRAVADDVGAYRERLAALPEAAALARSEDAVRLCGSDWTDAFEEAMGTPVGSLGALVEKIELAMENEAGTSFAPILRDVTRLAGRL